MERCRGARHDPLRILLASCAAHRRPRPSIGAPVTHEAVAAVERELGFKLPAAYIEFMRFQNGGIPRRTNHRTKERTSWAHDHIAITGIYSIGGEKRCSLLGTFGSPTRHREQGRPNRYPSHRGKCAASHARRLGRRALSALRGYSVSGLCGKRRSAGSLRGSSLPALSYRQHSRRGHMHILTPMKVSNRTICWCRLRRHTVPPKETVNPAAAAA